MSLGNNLFLILNLIPLQSNLAALIFLEKDAVHPCVGGRDTVSYSWGPGTERSDFPPGSCPLV